MEKLIDAATGSSRNRERDRCPLLLSYRHGYNSSKGEGSPLRHRPRKKPMQTYRRITLIAFLTVGIFSWLHPIASAQVYSGSITGLVTDATGAVIPNATVTLTDENKGFIFKAASGGDGHYVLRNLPPGLYRLVVSAGGMRNYERTGFDLEVGQNAQADVHLEVGAAAQVVEVAASAALLQTQDASTGQTVNQKFINDLPLVGRSVFNLAQISPGVSQAAGSSFGLNASPVNFVSNGGRNSTADIVMDGASQIGIENNGGITTALYTPPLDAVQEFTVQQNTYAADVGFGGNTVLNVITKSGTNALHGSAYEFLQNNILNANNFFNNQNGVPISPNKNNQFGGTIGGPIRKDKTFFFGDYQGTFTRSTGTARAGVPAPRNERATLASYAHTPEAFSIPQADAPQPPGSYGIL